MSMRKLALTLSTLVVVVIACDPKTSHIVESKVNADIDPKNLQDAKATFQESCTDSFNLTISASEKEVENFSALVNEKGSIYQLATVSMAETFTVGDKAGYLSAQSTGPFVISKGKAQNFEKVTQITCHNSKATEDKKAASPEYKLQFSLPNEIDTKADQVNSLAHILVKAVAGKAAGQVRVVGGNAKDTVKQLDALMAKANISFKLAIDNDQSLHVRGERKVTAGTTAKVLKFEAVFKLKAANAAEAPAPQPEEKPKQE